MPRFPLHHAAGNGCNTISSKTIRFVRYGCANRPFYHIVVMPTKVAQYKEPIEQLGSYDPMTNKYNELLVALNLERIHYWLIRGVRVSKPIAEMFGLAGLFPIHPRTYMNAWRNRRDSQNASENESSENKAAESVS